MISPFGLHLPLCLLIVRPIVKNPVAFPDKVGLDYMPTVGLETPLLDIQRFLSTT